MTANRSPVPPACLPLALALSLPLSAQGLYRDLDPVRMPRVWTVDDSGGADFTNLQAAVDAAHSGDVLLVAEGEYLEPCACAPRA